MPEIDLPGAMEQEPPTGSVVAIDWGEPRQEIWVSNRANVGSWYCPDIPMRGTDHPGWYDVRHRAEGRTLTLLTPGDRDTYAAGYDAGVATVQAAIDQIAGEYRLYVTGNYPAGQQDTTTQEASASDEGWFPDGDPRDDGFIGGYRPGVEGE